MSLPARSDPAALSSPAAVVGLLYPCIDSHLGEPHKFKREWASVMRCVAVFVGINHASAVSFQSSLMLLLMGVCRVLGQLNHPLTSIISNHVAQFPLGRAFEMVLKSPFGSFQETVKTTLGTEWKSL